MTSTGNARSRRVRVVTYNLLFGGSRREERITAVLERADADVIALQEASDTGFVRRLGRRLGMRPVIARANDASGLDVVVLSRLPIVRSRVHQHAGEMLRAHLECEVEVGGAHLERLRLHAVHLAARFAERANGEARRVREVHAILGDIDRSDGARHVIVGDFNALAPGDGLAASSFFQRMAELRQAGVVVRRLDGLVGPVDQLPAAGTSSQAVLEEAWLAAGIDPALEAGVPRLPRLVGPLTSVLPRSSLTDRVLGRFIERWAVQHLLEMGYVDCFRRLHPDEPGYTCATWAPAVRIDYIFADPGLAPRLGSCAVIGSRRRPDADVATASDHFPVVADFRT